MDWDVVRAQAGVFTRRQAREWGLSDRQLDRRLARGELRLAPRGRDGVLVTAGTPWSPMAALWVAVLSVGAPCALMGVTGAALYRWCDARAPIWVGVPRHRTVARLAGVHIHRSDIDEGGIAVLDGLPVTSKPRTLSDCLRFCSPKVASEVLDRSQQRDSLDLVEVAQLLPARGRGTRQARRLLAASDGTVHAAEKLFLTLLRRAGITGWRPNHAVRIGGRTFVIDVAFVAQMVAVEIDGFAYHSDVTRFRMDRVRQNALVIAGWVVLRFTWHDLIDDPQGVVAQVRDALATR